MGAMANSGTLSVLDPNCSCPNEGRPLECRKDGPSGTHEAARKHQAKGKKHEVTARRLLGSGAMSKRNVNSRALRQLALELLQQIAEDDEIPEGEREDFATSLVRQWITYDGS